jgi:hypothetical protein
MISKIKKKVLHHLADQLAHVLYSIKKDSRFPMRYPLVLMSLISLFVRLFVTKSIWISTFVSIFFASLSHFVLVLYIITYILPDKRIMDKAIKFIKDNRDSS